MTVFSDASLVSLADIVVEVALFSLVGPLFRRFSMRPSLTRISSHDCFRCPFLRSFPPPHALYRPVVNPSVLLPAFGVVSDGFLRRLLSLVVLLGLIVVLRSVVDFLYCPFSKLLCLVILGRVLKVYNCVSHFYSRLIHHLRGSGANQAMYGSNGHLLLMSLYHVITDHSWSRP